MFITISKEVKTVQNGEKAKTEKRKEKATVSTVTNALWFVLQESTSEMVNNENVSTAPHVSTPAMK